MFSRTISYIYDRENGRGGNLGFVKTEIRDGTGRMQLNLASPVDKSKVGFYLWDGEFIRCCLCYDNEVEVGFDVGNVAGVNIGKIGGVVINSGGRVMVAEWQDKTVDFDNILWVESLAVPEDKENLNVENISDQKPQDNEEVLVAQSIPDESPQENKKAVSRVEIPEFLKRKKKDKSYHPPINDWKDMFKYYDIVEPFSDGVIHSCVEIGYDDLQYLPFSCKNAVKNSFLLHGLYLHKHLLIGKYKCRKRQKIYVLGVPGNYENAETIIASMFGFDNFKRAKREGVPGAGFGYWYTLFKDDEINE